MFRHVQPHGHIMMMCLYIYTDQICICMFFSDICTVFAILSDDESTDKTIIYDDAYNLKMFVVFYLISCCRSFSVSTSLFSTCEDGNRWEVRCNADVSS